MTADQSAELVGQINVDAKSKVQEGVLGLNGKVLVVGGCRGYLCEKNPAAVPCQIKATEPCRSSS